MPRGVYDRAASDWKPPKANDSPELVERVRSMYESGMTIAEIQHQITGCKVQRIIAQHGIKTRRAIKRDQRGPRNHMWRGDNAGYPALHLRVYTQRGRPECCEWCGTTDGRMEWANLSGDYTDVYDFASLCARCHRSYDAARRRLTGRRTMPIAEEVVSHV